MTTPTLAALLLSELDAVAGAAKRDEADAIRQLDTLLAAQHADGAATWPTVVLPVERYVAHLARRVAARADEPAERVIATMPAADLYLAAACCDGNETAIAVFRDALAPSLRQALGKLAMPAATIDETIQRVMLMLFVGDGAAPQIAGYGGRGTLRSWVRTIAVRTGRRLLGREQSDAPRDDDLGAIPGAVADPELALLRERYRDQVRRAFAAAFGALTERQRNVLRQYHIDGLTIDQLAALYHINRATAARWVAGARLAIVGATRAHLVAELGASTREIDSIIRLVRSQLDFSVRELT